MDAKIGTKTLTIKKERSAFQLYRQLPKQSGRSRVGRLSWMWPKPFRVRLWLAIWPKNCSINTGCEPRKRLMKSNVILGLDTLGTKMLDSPNLDILIRYTAMYNQQKNIPQKSMITKLVKQIPSDKIYELVTKIPGSAKIIENLQYQYWLRTKKTPEQVKTILGLDNLGTKILDHPNHNIFVRFQRLYNQNHIPESAKTIDNLQYQYWLNTDKTPNQVKTILGLDNLGAKILDHPKMSILVRFQRMYNQKHGLPLTTNVITR